MNDFTCDTNYLQPSGFKVTISKSRFPYLAFLAQTIQHPSMEINSTDLGYKRMSSVPFIGDAIEFGTVTMEVILDENMQVYNEVYNWLQNMVESKHKLSSISTDTELSDYCDIRVSILSSANNTSREIQYVNAFPVTLGDVQLASTNDETYITVPMSFRFDYFDFL